MKATPVPTLRRFPRYLHLIQQMKEEGIDVVSSSAIANELGLDQTQVRKDIQFTGMVGKPKKGFDIDQLSKAIKEYLNWNSTTDAFLVGAGSLGTAIMGYTSFIEYGLNFVAAFDKDKRKVGKEINGIKVLPIDKLEDLCKRIHINIGVVTVPAEFAQEVADIMTSSGVTAIWNFAPTQIKVPVNCVVVNAQLTQSLAVLTRKLTEINIL